MALSSPPVTRATVQRLVENRLAPILGWARKAFQQVEQMPVLWGTGAPEGNVTAPLGWSYHRLDEGGGNQFFVKETGGEGWENATNTGWVEK